MVLIWYTANSVFWYCTAIYNLCGPMVNCYTCVGAAHFATRSEYGLLWRKQTSTTVMLSQPKPPIWQSGARHRVIRSSQILSGSIPVPTRILTKSDTSCNSRSVTLIQYSCMLCRNKCPEILYCRAEKLSVDR